MAVYLESADPEAVQGAIYIGESMPDVVDLEEARLRFTGQRLDTASK